MTGSTGQSGKDWPLLTKGTIRRVRSAEKKAGSAFNYHPNGLGLNHRTNLYYIETIDEGKTWQAADGTPLDLPLTDPKNPALVRDYETEGSKST